MAQIFRAVFEKTSTQYGPMLYMPDVDPATLAELPSPRDLRGKVDRAVVLGKDIISNYVVVYSTTGKQACMHGSC